MADKKRSQNDIFSYFKKQGKVSTYTSQKLIYILHFLEYLHSTYCYITFNNYMRFGNINLNVTYL